MNDVPLSTRRDLVVSRAFQETPLRKEDNLSWWPLTILLLFLGLCLLGFFAFTVFENQKNQKQGIVSGKVRDEVSVVMKQSELVACLNAVAVEVATTYSTDGSVTQKHTPESIKEKRRRCFLEFAEKTKQKQ